MKNQIRTVLPSFMNDELSKNDLMQMIEEEVGPKRKNYEPEEINQQPVATRAPQVTALPQPAIAQQSHSRASAKSLTFSEETKQASQRAPPKAAAQPKKTNYKSERDDAIIIDIEETMGCEIERPMQPFLEQESIPKANFKQAFLN